MTDTTRLELPWPPSTNRYYRSTPRGVLISEKGRVYRKAVAATLFGQFPRPLTSRLYVTVLLHAPTIRKYDIDNYMKAMLDAMEHAGVYANDEQIDSLFIRRGYVFPNGRVDVTIRELPTESEATDGN